MDIEISSVMITGANGTAETFKNGEFFGYIDFTIDGDDCWANLPGADGVAISRAIELKLIELFGCISNAR